MSQERKTLICFSVTAKEAGKAINEIVRALIHEMARNLSGGMVVPS
jgi:hypothetical protein